MVSLPFHLRSMRALIRLEWNLFCRNKTALFNACVLPIALLLYGFIALDLKNYAALLLTIFMATSVLMTVYYTVSAALVARREQQVLKRMISGVPTKVELLIAPAVPTIIIVGIQLIIAVGVLVALGHHFEHGELIALSYVGAMLTWGALAAATAAFSRTVESAQITTFPLFIIALLGSGLTIPYTVMPEMLARLSELTPMAPVSGLIGLATNGTDLYGSPVSGGELWIAVGRMLVVLFGWLLLAIFVIYRDFTWDRRS